MEMVNRRVDFEDEFRLCGPMRLYVYSKPGTMDPETHEYTDDVALTYATGRKWAIRHFAQLYDEVDKTNVHEVKFNADGVAILTNY